LLQFDFTPPATPGDSRLALDAGTKITGIAGIIASAGSTASRTAGY
jgi:hypothetical protein